MRWFSVLAAAAALLAFCGLSRSKSINVAAFNIQIFGQSKYGKPGVVPILVKIVQRYDLIFIQEIRDKSETVIFDFLDDVNSAEGRVAYAMNVSERLGTTSSKEQYVYMYRIDAIHIDDVFVISGFNNKFQRPPYVASVTVKNGGSPLLSFMAIGAHIKPDSVKSELNSLVEVYEAAKKHFGMSLTLLMGDFNANCTFLPNSQFESLTLTTDKRFTWLIHQDSTVAKSKCAYDRFVAAGGLEGYVRGRPSVFHYNTTMGLSREQANKVSDHYPIELELDDSLSPAGLTTGPKAATGWTTGTAVAIATATVATGAAVLGGCVQMNQANQLQAAPP